MPILCGKFAVKLDAMKRLFLTSSVGTPGIAASIRSRLGHTRPLKTAFITTPIEVEDMTEDQWYQDDRNALITAGFQIFDYTVSGKTPSDLEHDLAIFEAMYISGGNEFWLKHQSNKNGFDKFVRRFVASGKPYIGTSAGSIITAPDMKPTLQITDIENTPEPITDFSGFGIVDFLIFPHWGSQEFATRKYKQMEQAYGAKWKIILLNNYEYVEVQGDWFRITDVRNER